MRHDVLKASMVPATLALMLLILTAFGSPARADDAATFAGDGWVARCDASACKASLASQSHDEALLLGRWPSAGGLSIGLATPHGIADRERPIDVSVDDKVALTLRPGSDYRPLERVEAFWITDAHAAATALSALQKGKRLRISYLDMVGAPHDADFDLSALAKVVDFIDRQQHGGTDRPTGVAPPATVPPAPDVSRIDLIIRMGLPERLLIRHARASDCEDPASPRLKAVAPVIGPLSKTAILYAIPCTMSGQEITYRLWVIETGEIGGITPLAFALFDPSFGWRGSDILYNVSFDANGARLTSALKATQQGSCGYHAQLSADCAGGRAARIYPPN